MQFEVLGPLGMRIDGREIAPTGRLQRLLLGSLLVHRNRPVPSDVLIELLWPAQPPDRAAARLQLHIHRLRQLLDTPDRLSRTPQGYQLAVAGGDLDTDRLEASLDAAMNAEHDPRTLTMQIRDALKLWRGTPYDGIDAPELEAEARRLTERKLAAMEAMYDAEISRGNVAEIVAELGDLAGQYPLRERLQAQLMTALARSGRRADALEVYRGARTSYVEELGIEPGPELRGVHQAILAEDDAAPQDGGSVLTPAQLPLGVSAFHGRERELTAIDAALDTRRICVISGTAGVGKTALALHWAHEHRDHFPDGQLYVDLRGFSIDTPAQPRDTLAAFLRAFGLTGVGVPGDLDERAARLRSILADRRVLIVLDNAASVEQVRPLLPGTPGCAVLVTSRESIGELAIREGAHRIELDRLSEDDSVTLLSNLLGDATYADPGSVRTLAARCAYLPLALCIAAEQVRAMPARSVRDLVEEIDDEASRLDAFGTDTDVRAVFSWSYRALSADAATLFRQIGTITGRDIDEHALIAMSGLTPRTVRRAALALVRAHLIDESPGHRYSQHDLLHVYACELSEDLDTSAERAASQARLAAYYAYAAGQAADHIEPHTAATRPQLPKPPTAVPTFAGYDDALAWLETERANILATAFAVDGEVWPHLGDLSALLDLFLWNSGHAADALMLETAARDATRRRGDITRQATAERAIAISWSRLGRLDKAAEHQQRALELYRSSSNEAGEATILNNMAVSAYLRGYARDAVPLLRQCLATLRRLGDNARAATALSNLSTMQRTLKQYGDARTSAQEALDLARAHDFRRSEAYALQNLAEIARGTREYDDAWRYADEALELSTTSNLAQARGETLGTLGALHTEFGRLDEAVALHDQEIAIAEATEDPGLRADALLGLGRAHLRAEQIGVALVRLNEALQVALAHDLGGYSAHAYLMLGDAHAVLGNLSAAALHHGRALRLFTRLRAPEADGLRARLTASDVSG